MSLIRWLGRSAMGGSFTGDLTAEQRVLVSDVFKIIAALTITTSEDFAKHTVPRILQLMIHPNKAVVGEGFKVWWNTVRNRSDKAAEFQAMALIQVGSMPGWLLLGLLTERFLLGRAGPQLYSSDPDSDATVTKVHQLATRLALSYFAPIAKKGEVAYIISEGTRRNRSERGLFLMGWAACALLVGIVFAFTSSRQAGYRLRFLECAVLPFVRYLGDAAFANQLYVCVKSLGRRLSCGLRT